MVFTVQVRPGPGESDRSAKNLVVRPAPRVQVRILSRCCPPQSYPAYGTGTIFGLSGGSYLDSSCLQIASRRFFRYLDTVRFLWRAMHMVRNKYPKKSSLKTVVSPVSLDSPLWQKFKEKVEINPHFPSYQGYQWSSTKGATGTNSFMGNGNSAEVLGEVLTYNFLLFENYFFPHRSGIRTVAGGVRV